MKSFVVPRFEKKSFIGADEVEAYLRANPEFFQERDALLEVISIPHVRGEAISLVEKQLEVLRNANSRLQRQLDDLVEIARENDALYLRMHQLTLNLLNACTLEDAITRLQRVLHECFQADYAVIRLFEPRFETALADLFADDVLKSFPAMVKLMESGKPDYGRIDASLNQLLFGECVSLVQSSALLPLQHGKLKGVLAIGSESPERFHVGMGAMFLNQLGDIVAAQISALLNSRVAAA